MFEIRKYSIEVDAQHEGFFECEVKIPRGAKVISCAAQGAATYVVHVWAIVNENALPTTHWFGVLGTGHSKISESELQEGNFIGTVVNHPATWHIFDLGENR